MDTKRKELPVVGQQPAAQPPKPRGVEKGPLTLDEIGKIRRHPTASYLDLVRVLATYDESMEKIFFLVEEVDEARILSAKHYQHHADTMKMCQDLKEKLKIANETAETTAKNLAEANMRATESDWRAREEQKGRELMCSEAGKSLKEKTAIMEFIESSTTFHTYDSATDKNDVIVKFSKVDFENFLSSLKEVAVDKD
jgi:hypothetical protein